MTLQVIETHQVTVPMLTSLSSSSDLSKFTTKEQLRVRDFVFPSRLRTEGTTLENLTFTSDVPL